MLHLQTKEASPERSSKVAHPLAVTDVVTIEMEYDAVAAEFVTYVKELHRMSSFGKTEAAALDSTAEMIRGYIKSMEANHKKIPLSSKKLLELKRIVGLH
jgi:predicted RNase H-like HicB family nuclease